VSEQGRPVGHVSRCTWSPRLERNIGFANLPHHLAETGSRINIDCPGGDRQATVVESPWFPAQKILPTLDEIQGS
jgi:aminomethyltransferase